MSQLIFHSFATPLGAMTALVNDSLTAPTLVRLEFSDQFRQSLAGVAIDSDHPLIQQVQQQLEQYFRGQRQQFELPLSPLGTVFQQQAWQALQSIPYGQTRSYSEQAKSIGKPETVRAIGAANGRNPIAIVVPCHRVIGRNGKLTGYAGGLERKQALLTLERQYAEN